MTIKPGEWVVHYTFHPYSNLTHEGFQILDDETFREKYSDRPQGTNEIENTARNS